MQADPVSTQKAPEGPKEFRFTSIPKAVDGTFRGRIVSIANSVTGFCKEVLIKIKTFFVSIFEWISKQWYAFKPAMESKDEEDKEPHVASLKTDFQNTIKELEKEDIEPSQVIHLMEKLIAKIDGCKKEGRMEEHYKIKIKSSLHAFKIANDLYKESLTGEYESEKVKLWAMESFKNNRSNSKSNIIQVLVMLEFPDWLKNLYMDIL